MLAPNRTDWRWEQACKATEYSDTQAIHHLGDVELVRRAYKFKRAIDINLDGGRWPEIASAYELWANRPAEKLFIEGLLLADQDFSGIADEVGADPEDIEAYHDLFFDVKDKLHKPGWLVARLFQGGLYAPISTRDRVGIMHRLAWLAGAAVFRSYYTGARDVTIQQNTRDIMNDILIKQGTISAMCIGGRGELDIEVIRVCVEDTKRRAAEVIGGGADTATTNAIMQFLGGLNDHMGVGDHKAVKNLNLPAREPRAADYFQTNA